MMLEVTVKTLDGRNRNFCVPDDITVKAFKEKIAHSIEISADTQRLIYQGRVLQDDKILNDHDVNGKTIHVVQKPPPSAAGPNTANIDSDRPQASTTRHHHRPSTVVLGSYSVPTDGTPEQIQNIVQQALGGLGTLQPQGSSQSDPDGTSVDVHINLGPLNPQNQGNTAHLRISQMRRLLRLVHRGLDRLENPPNTSRDGSPMETTETPPSESSSSEDVSSNSQSETQTQPSTTQAEGATERANEQQSNRTAVLSQPPPLSSLDDLLSEVIRANTRLAPFLITYRTLLHDDPQFEPNSPEARSAQRLHLTVSEILHHLGHVNHHLSDCMIDYNSATPRHFRTPPLMPLTPAAVIQQTIPVQAQINVSRVSGSPQTPRRNPQPPPAAGSAAAPTSTSTASSADPISSTTIASGISGPAPPPQSATAPNPLGGLPPGVHVAASSQPYMFVDVSPDGININSVSAHVVTTSGPPPNAVQENNGNDSQHHTNEPTADFAQDMQRETYSHQSRTKEKQTQTVHTEASGEQNAASPSQAAETRTTSESRMSENISMSNAYSYDGSRPRTTVEFPVPDEMSVFNPEFVAQNFRYHFDDSNVSQLMKKKREKAPYKRNTSPSGNDSAEKQQSTSHTAHDEDDAPGDSSSIQMVEDTVEAASSNGESPLDRSHSPESEPPDESDSKWTEDEFRELYQKYLMDRWTSGDRSSSPPPTFDEFVHDMKTIEPQFTLKPRANGPGYTVSCRLPPHMANDHAAITRGMQEAFRTQRARVDAEMRQSAQSAKSLHDQSPSRGKSTVGFQTKSSQPKGKAFGPQKPTDLGKEPSEFRRLGTSQQDHEANKASASKDSPPEQVAMFEGRPVSASNLLEELETMCRRHSELQREKKKLKQRIAADSLLSSEPELSQSPRSSTPVLENDEAESVPSQTKEAMKVLEAKGNNGCNTIDAATQTSWSELETGHRAHCSCEVEEYIIIETASDDEEQAANGGSGDHGVHIPSMPQADNIASNANNASTAGTGAAQPQPMPNPMQGQPMLPPNMMQNILQMVSNAAMNRPPGQVGGSSQVFVMGPNGQPIPVQLPNQQQQPAAAGGLTTASTRPAAAAATATTAASTSQSNQSAQSGVGGARQAPFMFPGPPPRGMMFPPPGLMAGPFGPFPRPGNERMFDSFLPCSSRFANGGRRGRQRAEAANNNGSQPQPSVPTMNDHGLATMVSNLVSGLVGGNMPPPPPLTTAATSTTISGAAAATATAGENSAAAPAQQPYVLQLRDLLQQGQTTRPTPTSSTTSQTPASRSNTNSNSAAEAPPTQNVTDEVFAQLVSGIGTFVSESARGQTPTTSIADFLNNLGQTYNISQGEGFLTDVFNCVSQHLTFGDLMSVFFGVPDNLRRLRQPLQEFVRDRILRGDEPTDENIRRAVDALLDEAADDIAQIAQEAQARCGIDFAATLRAFANQQLILGIKLIVNSTDDLAFARELHAFIKKCIHEAIVLCRCCLQGGMRDVERLLQSRVQHIANDINPMIQQWMVAMTSQQLQVLTPNITVTEDEIQKYIVRRQQQQPAAVAKVQQETVATAAAATSSPASSEMVVSPAPPPSTAAAAQTTSPAHSHSSEASFMSAEEASTDTQAMDVDESGEFGARPRVPPQLLASLPAPPTTAGERLTPLQHGSEDWHRVLPQDWLPVINNDIQRQRRPQQPQAPFSDAYISGMPAKRRRMSSNYKTESAAQVLPPAVERAAAATRSRPVTSLESLTQDLSSDAGLHQAFQRELDQSMQERLSQDPDFIPEKYPNAQKYYKNK